MTAVASERVLELLELPRVLEALREGAMSPLGAAAALALRPTADPAAVACALAETTEARLLADRTGPFPLSGLPDLTPRLAALRVEGAVLPAPELVDVLHAAETAMSTRRALRHATDLAPRLAARAERLVELPHLAAAIRRAIGPQYEILDEASPELARIRVEKDRVRGQIQSSLERLLGDESVAAVIQDRVVTQRNDRYVIPVKTNYRGLLPGVVHDQSQSRATYFIEPLAVVDANNHLALLRQQEKEEEWRVLATLTADARRHRDALAANQAILGHLDLAQAKATLSRRLSAAEPRLLSPAAERFSGLALKHARHPLLLLQAEAAARAAAEASGHRPERGAAARGAEARLGRAGAEGGREPLAEAALREGGTPRTVVPVEITVEPAVRTLLVSGANAGGKTVSLKTLGLLVLMTQAGLHVPASPDSELPVFGQVFADIGDDQAILQGLSSFSAHVKALARVLREADGGSLVLLDELGTGTDPEEGSALAIAVLDRLRVQGALVVATTHLAPLKAYAYGREGAENVAVEFDPQSLGPTYRLIYGSSGQSNAIALARGFGFPIEVIAAAEATLAGGDSRAAALLRDIESARRKAVSELRRAERLRQRAAEATRAAEKAEAELTEKRAAVLARAREQAARTVAAADAEMRTVLEGLKARAAEAAVAPHVVAGAKGALRHAKARLADELRPETAASAAPAPADDDGALGPGDRVRVASLGREGDLVSIDAAGAHAEVAFGALKLKVPVEGLTRLGGRRRPAVVTPRVTLGPPAAGPEPAREVNVIGLRVDEALPVVDKSLDDAILAGLSRVAIIHGTGTGRLRAAIRDFLRTHRAVRSVTGGDPAHGGAGVTLVDLGG